jgi:sulfur-oxidizing protein SoxB
VGGLQYSIDPTRSIGERIGDMELNGKPIDPKENYVVAGWASVQEQPAGNTGRKIWDVVADYLRDHETVSISELNEPKLRGVEGNPGVSSV